VISDDLTVLIDLLADGKRLVELGSGFPLGLTMGP
jgi:hypothetical protein